MTPHARPTVPEPTLKRLPLYHRFLKERQFHGTPSVSCHRHRRPARPRPHPGPQGPRSRRPLRPSRVGYSVGAVIDGIEEFLGWKKVNEAFLVGAGSMGSALLGYRKFEECGLKIVAAFDADPARLGRTIHGKHVLPLEKLPDLARRMHVMIGIITVPASDAQAVAELLVDGGIRAIWNFAPVHLRVPENIILHNEDLYCSLASLSQKLARELQARPVRPAASGARAATLSEPKFNPKSPQPIA